eukprot:symbB.v1.2.035931.t1/scaffold4955.1/size32457/2
MVSKYINCRQSESVTSAISLANRHSFQKGCCDSSMACTQPVSRDRRQANEFLGSALTMVFGQWGHQDLFGSH